MNEHQERWAAVQAGTAQPASVADAIRAAISLSTPTMTRSPLVLLGDLHRTNKALIASLARAEALEALNEAAIILDQVWPFQPNTAAKARAAGTFRAALRRVREAK